VFFEKPKALQREHPDLYRVLADLYNLDLAARSEARPP
jgi:Mlc titration factor MtfA (ptsG expression regulator)